MSAALLLLDMSVVSALRFSFASARPAAAPTASTAAACRGRPLLMMATSGDSAQPPEDKDYSIDWDASWQAEQLKRNAGQAEWRPEGREPVSEQQVLQARGQRIADDTAATLQGWTGDWRLWVGILLAVSVLTALASHSSEPQSYSV